MYKSSASNPKNPQKHDKRAHTEKDSLDYSYAVYWLFADVNLLDKKSLRISKDTKKKYISYIDGQFHYFHLRVGSNWYFNRRFCLFQYLQSNKST